MSNPLSVERHARPTSAALDGNVALRRLYFVRFGFAIVWAGLLAATASELDPVSGTLLVIYPLFDLGAAVVDYRSAEGSRPRGPLRINMALSLITAAALAVAASSEIPDVLRVWGAWAITAGLVQLVVAIQRRRLGGQWAMILSGAISTVAGAAFVAMSEQSTPSLTGLAGYATLGGIFFLTSALRLGRTAADPTR